MICYLLLDHIWTAYHIWSKKSIYGCLVLKKNTTLKTSHKWIGVKPLSVRKEVADRIIYFCNERNMALNALARISAVPPSTLKNIVNGVSQNPGIVTIKKLCDGLGIDVVEFFTTEEFKNLEQEIK